MKNKTLKNLTVISGALMILGAAWWCVEIIIKVLSLIFGFENISSGGLFFIPLVLGFIMALLFAGKWFDKFKNK
jgi:flagellar biosynthesis protein FliQ